MILEPSPAYRFAAAFVLLLASSLAPAHPSLDSGYQRTTEKAFENVLWDLRFAVTQRNFRIVGRNRIGKALRQRGHEDFSRAQVLEFCNLTHTHRALTLDWRFLRACPNRIAVYEGPEGVVVSAELWPVVADDPDKAAIARKVNGLLREMVDFAAD